ncbi:hypothetical protein [Streptomyces sp. NPDC048521]|uniref:hypothetical protein n=1 Tax=Streptomyces sp. NPDC048521 TaxID=3365566 RepID=UPI003718E78F
MGRKIEDLQVEVDELGLSLVGWQVDDVRARLMTDSFDDVHFQEIVVSGTARFLPEDWTERFTGDDPENYPPTLLIGVSHAGAPDAVTYGYALLETIRKAGKRPVRFSKSSRTWECATPVRPDEITLRMTSFDLEETNIDFVFPSVTPQPLPLDVIDETAHEAVRLKPTAGDAVLVGKDTDRCLQVRLGGFAEFQSADRLLADLVAVEEWRSQDLAEECPFETPVPGLAVEVVDSTGFLLDKRETSLYGRIPVGEGGRVPSRRPRWIAQYSFDLDDLPGEPDRVVVRLLDAEDL